MEGNLLREVRFFLWQYSHSIDQIFTVVFFCFHLGHLKFFLVGSKKSCIFALTILRIRRPQPKLYPSAFYLYNSLIRETVFTHTSSICLPIFCLFFILLRICQSARLGSSMRLSPMAIEYNAKINKKNDIAYLQV